MKKTLSILAVLLGLFIVFTPAFAKTGVITVADNDQTQPKDEGNLEDATPDDGDEFDGYDDEGIEQPEGKDGEGQPSQPADEEKIDWDEE